MKILHGDCLDLMKEIPDGSIDMILCDLPYGSTKNAWDVIIPLEPLWAHYKRIIKEHGVVVLFGRLPFSAHLVTSATVPYRYDWVWVKSRGSGFLNARRMPLRAHESILVFYKEKPVYHAQMRPGKAYTVRSSLATSSCYGQFDGGNVTASDGWRYPLDVLTYSAERGSHPTQKPVPLLEYLIRTYTDTDAVVLDNCMGSGSTGVACVRAGRDFIGMEMDGGYFEIAKKRIEEAQQEASRA